MTLLFAGCKKDVEPEASVVKIVDENIEKGSDYINIDVEYDYPVELEAVTLYLSEKEDMSGAKTYNCKVEGKKFSVEVKGIKDETGYYFYYEYNNGYEKEKSGKKNMQTIVVTEAATNVTPTTAVLKGSVTNNDSDNKITEMGLCWGTEQDPTIEGEHYNIGTGNAEGVTTFTYELVNLQDNVTYYFRSYVVTSYGIIYGEEKSFTTVEILLPTVATREVTNIKARIAICGGNVTFDGNSIVTARGVCWSTLPNPTIKDNKTTDGSGTGSFTSNIPNLVPNIQYYVRSYATNEKGTVYGEEKCFKTLPLTGISNGYEYVDLGLPSGLLWATCNVGANTPEENGNYYAWGETATKETYDEDNCVTYGLTISMLRAYGYIDESGNLASQYDAATANWGGNWRMPTDDEFYELCKNCTLSWIYQNNVSGCKVVGPNGKSIFLPAVGVYIGSSIFNSENYGCYYWSSTPCEYDDIFNDDEANDFVFFYNGNCYMTGGSRICGESVRPVLE